MTKPEIEDWIKAKGIQDSDFMDSGMIDYITDILVDFQSEIVGDKEYKGCDNCKHNYLPQEDPICNECLFNAEEIYLNWVKD